MSRWIDADALIKEIRKSTSYNDYEWSLYADEIIDDYINEAPSIDVEPKRGEWEIREIENVLGTGYILTCSVCGDTFRVSENALPYEHYCRYCGAEMRGKGDE